MNGDNAVGENNRAGFRPPRTNATSMFERIEVPTPFQVGAVNCYLAERTVVDPGPDSDDAWRVLTETLGTHGITVDDLERVLITHPHPDHFGMAKRLRDRGVSIVSTGEAADIIEDFPDRLAYEQSFFEPFFVAHGLSPDVASTVVDLPEAYLEFAPSVHVDRQLDDRDRIDIDSTAVTAESVQGHAPGELIFTYEGESGECAIVGDHVLDPITPNPFLQPPPTPDEPRPRVLPAFNRSLDRLGDRNFERLLPGHRGVIEEPTHRIDQLRRFHDRRTQKTLEAIDGQISAADIMESLFGSLPVTEIYSGMSEAIGHLDVLEQRGDIRRITDGDSVLFARPDQ